MGLLEILGCSTKCRWFRWSHNPCTEPIVAEFAICVTSIKESKGRLNDPKANNHVPFAFEVVGNVTEVFQGEAEGQVCLLIPGFLLGLSLEADSEVDIPDIKAGNIIKVAISKMSRESRQRGNFDQFEVLNLKECKWELRRDEL